MKTGTEAYVLGSAATASKKGAPILEAEKIRIVVGERWREREKNDSLCAGMEE